MNRQECETWVSTFDCTREALVAIEQQLNILVSEKNNPGVGEEEANIYKLEMMYLQVIRRNI